MKITNNYTSSGRRRGENEPLLAVKQFNIAPYIFMLPFVIFLTIIKPLSAQDIEIEEDGEIQTGEIIIEKDRNIVLPQARKLYEKVKSPEFKIEATKIPIEFKTFNYSPKVQLPSLRAAQPKTTSSREEIYDHYFKVGYGNFGSPLLQADLNLLTDKTKAFRVKLDHLSFGKGAKDGKNSASSYTSAGIDGKVIGDGVTLTTGVGYTTTTDHFYGYQPGLVFEQDNIRHKYNGFNANIGIEDNDAKNDVDYSLGVGFYSIKDNLSASESAINIDGGFNYGKNVFVEAEFIFSKYKQSSFDLSRNFIKVKPYYQFEAGEVRIDAGFSFSTISGGGESFGPSTVFPYTNANYSISDQVKLYAVLDGGMSFNSYTDYANDNLYLAEDIPVESSRVNYDFTSGLSIKASRQFSLNPYLQIRSVKNMGMYWNITRANTDYVIRYISGNTNILEFGSGMQFVINPYNQISLNAAILTYSSKETKSFFHLPSANVEFNSSHKIMDKLSAGLQFNLLSGMKAPEFLSIEGFLEGDPLVKLTTVTELNLNLDYQINDRVGAFLQFNNILNKNYERYYNYPMRGLQVKAGVSFRL